MCSNLFLDDPAGQLVFRGTFVIALYSDMLTWLELAIVSEIEKLSEIALKVGKKGEIFTTAEIRKKANIKEGARVSARVVGNKLVIEPIASIEEILRRPVVKLTTKEAEELSEEAQKEEGIYG